MHARLASSRCVMPASMRAAAMRRPIFISSSDSRQVPMIAVTAPLLSSLPSLTGPSPQRCLNILSRGLRAPPRHTACAQLIAVASVHRPPQLRREHWPPAGSPPVNRLGGGQLGDLTGRVALAVQDRQHESRWSNIDEIRLRAHDPPSPPPRLAAACSPAGTPTPAAAPGAVPPSRPSAAAGTPRERASARPRGTARASPHPLVLR